MRRKSTQQSAASSEAGYPSQQIFTTVAAQWMVLCRGTEGALSAEKLHRELDHALRRRIPDGVGTGILCGRDAEIRQLVHLLLFQRYLAGNERLMAATEGADLAVVENEIQRSANAAVYAASRQLLRALKREKDLHEYHPSPGEIRCAVYDHPAARNDFWDLPFESQRKLFLGALRKGLQENVLALDNVEILIMMIDGGHSQARFAGFLGISRQALNQRLAPVRRYLRVEIQKKEFPIE